MHRLAIVCTLLVVLTQAWALKVNNWFPSGLYDGDFTRAVQLDTVIGPRAFATAGPQVYRALDDCGISWEDVSDQFGGRTVNCFYGLANVRCDAFAGTSDGVYTSSGDCAGRSWTRASTGMAADTAVYCLTGLADGTLLAGTSSGLYISANTGATWSRAASLGASTAVYSIATSPDQTAVRIGTSDGVWRSEDLGKWLAWTEDNNDETDGMLVVRLINIGTCSLAALWQPGAVPTCEGLYAAPWSAASWAPACAGLGARTVYDVALADAKIYAATDDGLYVSADSGATWSDYSSGLPDRRVHFVTATGSGVLCGPASGGVYSKGRPILSPTLVSPANHATGLGQAPTLTWSYPVGTPTSYEVVYSTKATFDAGTINTLRLQATSLALDGLTPDITYYWRVRALIGGFWTECSPASLFSTTPPNSAPTAPVEPEIGPAFATAGVDLSVVPAGSTDPEGDELTYVCHWRHSSDGGTTWSEYSLGTGDHGATLSGSQTAPREVWQARVAASDGLLTSAWTESATFTVSDRAPSAPSSVSATPALPMPTQGLTGDASGAVDPDGDAVTYTFEWACSADDLNWADWGHQGPRLPSTLTAVNQYWKARACATAAGLSSAWVESSSVRILPMLAASRPLDGALDTNRTHPVTIVFSWPMDADSAEAHFSLTPAGGAPVSGTFVWPNLKTCRFTPDAPLAAGTLYTVSVQAGVLRANGTVLTWSEAISFTTVDGPVVTLASPAGTVNKATPAISATFDVAMNKTTVQKAFRLTATGDTTVLPGTFTWPEDNRFIFTPDAPLASASSYTVYLAGACRAQDTRLMRYTYSWNFRTATLPAAVVMVTGSAQSLGNGTSAVSLNLSADCTVDLAVLNLAGRTIAVLPGGQCPAGVSTLIWNGRSSAGTNTPRGMYLVQVHARAASGNTSRCLIPLQR